MQKHTNIGGAGAPYESPATNIVELKLNHSLMTLSGNSSVNPLENDDTVIVWS